MYFEQHYLTCLAQASYFIADTESGSAVVVDPKRDIEPYLAVAEKHGWKIEHVYLTHFHADFLAGHLELRERTGAKIHLGARAEAEFDFVPESDGSTLELGPLVRIVAMETPGHTPESISLQLFDSSADDSAPQILLTGDALFIGDVGRPDLLASIGYTKAELGRMLYESLHNKILKLPDEVLVYPAHGAGSMCGKNLSDETSSTLGEQRRTNYALQPMTPDEFLAVVTQDQPAAPAYFLHDADLNRREFPTLAVAVERGLEALTLDGFLAQANRGAQVVDTRDGEAFARGHLARSLNIGLEGKYATWAGSLLDLKRPVILIADPGREEEAILRLGRIGFDIVIGYLDGAALAWEDRSELLSQFDRLDALELSQEIEGADTPKILDVRSPGEFAAGHLENALNIPLPELGDRLDELRDAQSMVIHCAGGYRSVIAASLLEAEGFSGLRDLRGGFEAWTNAHQAVVQPNA
ncbi:MAG: MBL fold metallo-hydrolase [Planctomycetes bacterium]|nr:MBL fold metallo-hydrolase [Planctomycetota bacterium]